MKSIIFLISLCIVTESYGENKKPFKEKADIIHSKLSEIFGRSLAYIDNLVFRNQELEKDTGSRLYLFNRTSYTNDGIFVNDIDFRLNLRFPRISKSLQFSLEGNNRNQTDPNQIGQNINNNNTNTINNEDNVSGSVNYFDDIKNLARYKVSTGVRAGTTLKPFVRALLFREDKILDYEFRPYFQYSWTYIDGKAQEGGFMFGKSLAKDISFRWFVDQRWNEIDQLNNISAGPSLFQKLSPRRAINYNFRYIYEGRKKFPLKLYEFLIGYRQNLYKDWFYAEGGPFISFKRENRFEQEHGAFIKFEVAFGRF